jgi:hypothetical protein
MYGNRITTNNISNLTLAFNKSSLEDIPFEINMKRQGSLILQLSNAFKDTPNLVEVPVINGNIERLDGAFDNCAAIRFRSDIYFNDSYINGSIRNMINMPNLLELPYIYNLYFNYNYSQDSNSGGYELFRNCKKIKTIPEDYTDTWSLTRQWTQYDFADCHSLRTVPTNVLDVLYWGCTYHYQDFLNCYALEVLSEFPLTRYTEITSNMFSGFVSCCSRLSKFTFYTKTASNVLWSNQTLDLSKVGYDTAGEMIGSGRGEFTADNQVIDDATYQALKNNPDWWTANVNYSRYNKTSALETINSLPDTSAFGVNLIKFNANQGSYTDGGAIGTMTPEEIAVATNKGWAVSFA